MVLFLDAVMDKKVKGGEVEERERYWRGVLELCYLSQPRRTPPKTIDNM